MLYLFRKVLIVIWLVISCLVVLPICFILPFRPSNGRRFTKLFSPLSQWILGYEQEVHGIDKVLNLEKGIILASHQDSLDLIVYGGLINDKMVTIGKKQIKWIPFFGQVYWLSDHLLIDRSNRRRAVATIERAVEKIHQKGYVVWIMPEGTRSRGKGLQKFKKGAFHLALQAKLPLYPVVFTSINKALDFNKWNAGKIEVDFLDPIETSKYDADSMEELMSVCYEKMSEAIERLDSRIKG